jgi:lysophospholipase L1-like esterase
MILSGLAAVVMYTAVDYQWVTSWTASSHGPYPAGNPVAQPDLTGILSPDKGASDQTFRLIVKPGRWGFAYRIRFTNVFGSKPLTIDGAFAGTHEVAGRVATRSNMPVRFQNKGRVTIPPGQLLYSDPVRFSPDARTHGSKLAISFHVVGDSGPMTWHAKAISTSYLSPPGSGSHGEEYRSDAFPHTTTSWFFIDAVDVAVGNPCEVPVIAAFGDSITDGTGSTINGDDRYPDFLAQRLEGSAIVLNAGIGGNRIVSDAPAGGPSALNRMERDLLSLSGIRIVIWTEGINDLGSKSATAEQVIAGFREGAKRLHDRGIRVIGGTLTSAFKSTPTHGTAEVDEQRKIINAFIRNSGGVFDGVADFDAATVDQATGMLKPLFWPNSAIGGPGDGLHPNRAGYQAMANVIDLNLLPKALSTKPRVGAPPPCSPAPAASSNSRK